MDHIFTVEQAVLGSMICHPPLVRQVLDRVAAEDFSGPHLHVAQTLDGMASLNIEITPFSLVRRLDRAGLLARVGGAATIHSLVAAMRYPGEALALVETLESQALTRRLRGVADRLHQRLDNPTIEPEEAARGARDELEQVGEVHSEIDFLGWPEGDVDPEPAWVIPHLAAADERIMLTGGEGLGKSMLIRQLLASVAVGYHPFLAARFDPAPVLHVDLENPRSVSDSAWRRIRNGLRLDGVTVPGTLYRLEPRRFDVNCSSDVTWLRRAVRSIEPKAIGIGPLKNMISEDPNDELAAVKVQSLLREITSESGALLILEAHAGHVARGDDGDWRPRGSSAWLGWPEVGYGMRPVRGRMYRAAQLVQWRGPRVEGRMWPEMLAEGTVWPWVEAPPE